MIFATQDQINDYENAYQRPGYSIVYGLCDPQTKEIRYIGVTADSPRRRYNSHTSDRRRGVRTHKTNWMRQVFRETGRDALPAFLDVVPNDKRDQVERKLISENRARLVNGTDGGEGILGLKHSEETKKKISASKRDPSLKAVRSFAKGGFPVGSKKSEETKRRMSEAQKKRFSRQPRTEETKQKMSKAHKELWASRGPKVFSDEHKQNISKALKGRTFSDETRKKQSEAAKARWKRNGPKKFSDETRRRISQSQKDRWARIRADG